MPIFKGSRYYYAPIDYVAIEEDTAAFPVVGYEFPSGGALQFVYHVVVEGERLDQISNKYYGRPSMWWSILEVNPHVDNPLNITPGTVLRVPA